MNQTHFDRTFQTKEITTSSNHQQTTATTDTPQRPESTGVKTDSRVVTQLRFFTVPEIADLLQMKRERVYEAVRLGLVPSVHIGRQIRIEEKAFLDWVQGGGQTYAAGWRHKAS